MNAEVISLRAPANSKGLHIAKGVYLPLDAITQTFGLLARKGGGKTYAASKLAEEMLRHQAQVVVLDPVGNWYGLRLASDGKGKGFDIPVFGGMHGDLPLNPDAGKLIADIIVDTVTPAVLDVSAFRKGERKKFVADFAEQLFHRMKTVKRPVHLMIEEAQVFAPQQPKGSERMLGAIEDIVRLGRNYGIGSSLISQRPQSVNKEVLNQVEALFVFQTSGPHEKKAISEWIVSHGLDHKELLKELPALEVGTGYLWSPQWLGILKKIKVAKKRTFDASSTPKLGEKRIKPGAIKKLDLVEIEKSMSELIEKRDAEDPRKLQAKVIKLENEISDLMAAASRADEESRDNAHEMFSSKLRSINEAVAELSIFNKDMTEQLAGLVQKAGEIYSSIAQVTLDLSELTQDTKKQKTRKPTLVSVPSKPKTQNNSVDAGISNPQQRIVDALGSFRTVKMDKVRKEILATFVGVSYRSSGYRNNLSSLKQNGLIEYLTPGTASLTEHGQRCIKELAELYSMRDLHQSWHNVLPKPQSEILSQALKAWPHSIDKEDLAGRVKKSHTSSGYRNNLSSLRTLNAIEYPEPGRVRATDMMFPEQLR